MTPFHARTLATTLAVSLGIALAPSAQAITFDILAVEIRKPVFMMGLPRTGSTIMHDLLALFGIMGGDD